MKKFLFMMFLLGGLSIGFTSCGGDDDQVEDAVEEAADEVGDAVE